MEGMLLSGSLAGSHLADIFIQPKITYLRMALPPVGWAILHKLSIKIIPHRHAHRPICSSQFAQSGLASLMMLNCIKMVIKDN